MFARSSTSGIAALPYPVSLWQRWRNAQPRHADARVGHTIVQVEALRVVLFRALIDAGREDDVGHDAFALLRGLWREQRPGGSIEHTASPRCIQHHDTS